MAFTNVSSITAAIVTQLQGNLPSARWKTRNVERGVYVNHEPGRTPWVGVYRASVEHNPNVLGSGGGIQNWDARLKVSLVVQAAGYKGGDQAEDNMELYVQDVLTALDADRTLGGTVDTVIGYGQDYSYRQDDSGSIAFQECTITLTAELEA